MKKIKYISFIVLALTLFSCAQKVAYTPTVQQKYKLGDQEVRLLQFYLAGDITLYNGNRDASSQTEGGELVIKDEQNTNKIVVPSGTHGIVERVENGVLYVSFEEGKNLKFVSSNVDGKYRAVPTKEGSNGRKMVNYGGEDMYISTTSLRAYLVFKLKNSTKRRSTQKTVKGRKL